MSMYVNKITSPEMRTVGGYNEEDDKTKGPVKLHTEYDDSHEYINEDGDDVEKDELRTCVIH